MYQVPVPVYILIKNILMLIFSYCNFLEEAYVTLATNDSYCKGALVLGHSLKQTKTSRNLVVIIGPMVSKSIR